MDPQELSFRNFFSDLIFFPEHARPKDQNKCLIISIALGIFSLGIIPLFVGIGWVVRKVVLLVTEKSPLQEKTDNVFRNNFKTNSTQRKGFYNSSGSHCFFASALQCLASVRQHLPIDASQLQDQETANQILALLDKVLSGTEGSDQELAELEIKLGLEGKGDARAAIASLTGYLGIDQINFFDDAWDQTSNPIWINQENFVNFFKAEKGETYTYKYPLADKTNQKLNFFMLLRSDLSSNLADRKSGDVPQLIQVPIANQPNSYDLYELVTTAQSLGGHAIAYTKEDAQWLEFNDHTVSKLSNDMVEENIKKHSMILVYCRAEAAPPLS